MELLLLLRIKEVSRTKPRAFVKTQDELTIFSSIDSLFLGVLLPVLDGISSKERRRILNKILLTQILNQLLLVLLLLILYFL